MHKVMEEMYAKACVTENSCLSITCQWWQSVSADLENGYGSTHTHLCTHTHTQKHKISTHSRPPVHTLTCSLPAQSWQQNKSKTLRSILHNSVSAQTLSRPSSEELPPPPRPLLGSKVMKHKYSKTPSKDLYHCRRYHVSYVFCSFFYFFFPHSLCPAKLCRDCQHLHRIMKF